MLVTIGSRALNYHYPTRLSSTVDLVGTSEDFQTFLQSQKIISCYPKGSQRIIKTTDETYSYYIASKGSSSETLIQLVGDDGATQRENGFLIPSLNMLYLLKMSHRYLKNSPDFLKTMEDIWEMRQHGAVIDNLDFYKIRQKETYTYSHPKLNVTKSDFFAGDGIDYIYDHDTIHESTKTMEKPAYAYFKPDEQEVFCSKEMFYSVDEKIRLAAVLEESQVLALERSQVPFQGKVDPKKSFDIALFKVCTSITSGWFREFAWENYYKVQSLYNPNYVDKFWSDVESGIVRKL